MGVSEVSFWRLFRDSWRIIMMSCLVHCATAVDTIVAPGRHVAFTSDLTVSYDLSSNITSPVYLQLTDKTMNAEIHKSQELTEHSGHVVFGCEYFDGAGIYLVRMLSSSNNDVITESDDITVTWPIFSFLLPTDPQTFSNLEVTLQTSELSCFSSVISNLILVLEYLGSNPESDKTERTTVESHGNQQLVGEFPCDLNTKEGSFKVRLEYSTPDSIIISSSQIFQIVESSSVTLAFPADVDSLENCRNNLNITYLYSGSCHFVPSNIAVFAVTSPAVSFTDPSALDLEFVEEHEAGEGGNISLDCGRFETNVYRGYCFKYQGLSESGDVVEAAVRCLPSRQNMGGTWGPWSDWGSCTATCGDSLRRRTRICIGGAECDGNPYNVASCDVHRCLDDIPRVVARDVESGPVNPSSCNHVLSTPTGNLSASPMVCPSGATWIIRVAANKRIRLKFLTFNLYLPQEYVRVRDGVNARAGILAFHTGQLVPESVTSSSNQIYVEYEVYDKGKPPIRGFTASYASIALPKPKPSVAGALADTDGDAGGMSKNTTIILVVGVSLLVLLLVLSLVMTIIIRFKEERHDHRSGAIQKIYTGPSGSYNSSSNQRLFGCVPGHSTTSPSEHSHQSVSKRGFPDGNGNGDRSQMYLIPENSNMQYLPETALSSPFKSNSEIQSVSELPSPYKEETGPKWPVPKEDGSLPFNFGGPRQSTEDFSRQSEIMTDKNTVHLANKTPSEYTTRGYSARGSTRGSRSSVDSRQKRVHANVENSDNTSPFVSPDGELTLQGRNASSKGLKRPTRLNRSPEGAESPDTFDNEGTLTRHHRSGHGHRDDGRSSDKRQHRSHRSSGGHKSSKSGLSSDAGVYSPGSTAERSTGSKSASSRHSKGLRHNDHHNGSGKRRKSPSHEERILMKDMNSSNQSSHHRRKRSPSSPRSKSRHSEEKSRHSEEKSRHSEGKSPRTPRSQSSAGSGRNHRPNSKSPSRHGGKVYSPSTSDNSRYNSLPYSRGEHNSRGNQSPISEASPIRLPKPLSIKQNRDQYKHVFISDESLMNRVSGTDRSGAESSKPGNANRNLLNTPSSESASSPTKSLNVRRVYSDKSLSPEEPAYDDYMPSIPGSYFENPYPQPVPTGPPTGNLAVV